MKLFVVEYSFFFLPPFFLPLSPPFFLVRFFVRELVPVQRHPTDNETVILTGGAFHFVLRRFTVIFLVPKVSRTCKALHGCIRLTTIEARTRNAQTDGVEVRQHVCMASIHMSEPAVHLEIEAPWALFRLILLSLSFFFNVLDISSPFFSTTLKHVLITFLFVPLHVYIIYYLNRQGGSSLCSLEKRVYAENT